MINPHAEYTLQTLLYVSRLAAQDDYSSALGLGLRPDQMHTIGAMNTHQLHEMALTIKTHIMRVLISPEALDTALRITERRALERETIFRMIKAGASFRMMNELFGLSNTEHANYRKLAGLSNQGRPEIPSEEHQDAIWESWKSHEDRDIKARLLAVHDDTGVALSSLWLLIQTWKPVASQISVSPT